MVDIGLIPMEMLSSANHSANLQLESTSVEMRVFVGSHAEVAFDELDGWKFDNLREWFRSFNNDNSIIY